MVPEISGSGQVRLHVCKDKGGGTMRAMVDPRGKEVKVPL
jgi:hypothetical protein